MGGALLAGGAALFAAGGSVLSVGAAMVGAGVGWSLVNAGLLQWLYGAGTPTRLQLALHDFALLAAALLGALAAPLAQTLS